MSGPKPPNDFVRSKWCGAEVEKFAWFLILVDRWVVASPDLETTFIDHRKLLLQHPAKPDLPAARLACALINLQTDLDLIGRPMNVDHAHSPVFLEFNGPEDLEKLRKSIDRHHSGSYGIRGTHATRTVDAESAERSACRDPALISRCSLLLPTLRPRQQRGHFRAQH